MRSAGLWAALAASVGCASPGGGPVVTGGTPPTTGGTGGLTVAAEVCDGADNDGDGDVDEGFEDFDADGVADCVDGACEVASEPLAVETEVCTSPFDASELYTLRPGGDMVNAGVRLGRVVDHDGDGDVDADDSPTLIVPRAGGLDYYDAATGILDGTVPGTFMFNGGAVADVDGDGDAEVLALRQPTIKVNAWTVVAFDRDGREVWQSPPHALVGDVAYTDWICHLTVGDLDGDGDAEVLCDTWVYDGATGDFLFDLQKPDRTESTTLTVVDLDLDGTAEVLHGDEVYDHDGAVAWSAGLSGDASHPWQFAAPAQLDADPEAEVVVVNAGWNGTPGELYAFEADGTLIAGPWATGGSPLGGPPCVADFDGDGASEVAVGFASEVALFDTDGALLWSAPVHLGMNGCSAFDFDADGTPELACGAQEGLVILDAGTGEVRYRDDSFDSGETYLTTPMIADIDADGHSDLVAVGGRGFEGFVRAWSHVRDGWPDSGPSWPIDDFAVGRVSDDGAIALPAYWATDGYHARPATSGLSFTDDPGVDLRVDALGSCAASCDGGPVAFAVQVSNQGGVDAAAGKLLELSADDVVIASATLPAIASGGAAEVTLVVDDPAAAVGTLVARVDSSGELCDASDDAVELPPSPCP